MIILPYFLCVVRRKGMTCCVVCLNGTIFVYLKGSTKTVYMGHRCLLIRTHKYRKMANSFDGKIEKDSQVRGAAASAPSVAADGPAAPPTASERGPSSAAALLTAASPTPAGGGGGDRGSGGQPRREGVGRGRSRWLGNVVRGEVGNETTTRVVGRDFIRPGPAQTDEAQQVRGSEGTTCQ
jgi:hypothetical protein